MTERYVGTIRHIGCNRKSSPVFQALAVTSVALFFAALSGCHRPLIQAHRLPPHVVAPSLASAEKVDLSKLAGGNAKSELIYTGDLLELTIDAGVEEDPPRTTVMRVDDSGQATVPLVGPLRLAGLELTQAERAIWDVSRRRGIYRDPHVSLLMKERRNNQVTVLGAVAEPGEYKLPVAGSNLLSALRAAGGLNDEAGVMVEIRHPSPDGRHAPPMGNVALASTGAYPRQGRPGRSVRVDLLAASTGRRGDYHLEDGSVVMVMKKPGRSVHVIGLVNKPNHYDIPPNQDLHLLEALSLAGGRRLQLADKVHIIRRVPRQAEPAVIEASVGRAKRDAMANIRLAPGDVVSVEETPLTFTIETLRSFIRFGFSAGIPGL